MFECKMERTIDCRKNWKLKQTAQGMCLTLQPNDAYEYKKLDVERKRKRNKKGTSRNLKKAGMELSNEFLF